MVSCRDIKPPAMFRMRTGAVVQIMAADTESSFRDGTRHYYTRRASYLVLLGGAGRNRPGTVVTTYILALARRIERHATPDDFKEK